MQVPSKPGPTPSSDRARYRAYYEEGYKASHPVDYSIGGLQSERPGSLRPSTLQWLKETGLAGQQTAIVLELGCAMAQLANVHPGYLGLDFSHTALAGAKAANNGLRLLHGDMQVIPLATESVDFMFTWAALEHVPSPDRVLAEVTRILKPNGVALLGPAWNCRSWTVKRLPQRFYRDLSWRHRIEKATIPLRSRLAWRAAMSSPKRFWREMKSILGNPIRFDFQPLFPDFSLELPHVSDDDAQACMDPHAAILYFKTRGWAVLSHPTFRSRILARHEAVVVRKPA